MGIYEELSERGLIAQVTHEEPVRKLLNEGSAVFYIGFDPTADSLHVGHFLQLAAMSRLQKAGHKPIALLGGGTGMVGDPTGRTDMRRVMTREEIDSNVERFREQMGRFISFEDGRCIAVNNADWLLSLNYVDFLRDVGIHFSVNRMLSFECFKSRYERGLSFFEFNYMLMQSYDFLYLYRNHGCTLQVGGDDQWSNILGGVELVRRAESGEAFGLTLTLLTTSDGRKMGKTQSGAVWLDSAKTSPYDFFQYWRNVDDADVFRCMRMLTELTLPEIASMESASKQSGGGAAYNAAKERLAFELTKTVHGESEADKALETAHALFGSGADSENMPTTEASASDFAGGGITAVDLLVLSGLSASRGDAKRVIDQGGLTVNDVKVSSASEAWTAEQAAAGLVLRKGKKSYHKIILK